MKKTIIITLFVALTACAPTGYVSKAEFDNYRYSQAANENAYRVGVQEAFISVLKRVKTLEPKETTAK